MPDITHPDLPGSRVTVLDEAVAEWARAGWIVTDEPAPEPVPQAWVQTPVDPSPQPETAATDPEGD